MPRPPRISRDAVLGEAVRILDEEGAEALTMRRLAQRLGVTSPSLYKYFRSLEEVLEAVTDVIVREIGTRSIHHAHWRAELTELARGYFRVFQRHPNAMPLVMRRPVPTTTSLTGLDAVLQVLLDSGWDIQPATRALLLVESYALGAAMTAAGSAIPHDLEQLEGRPALAAALEARHPLFRLTEADFEHGLALLLDGMARESAPPCGETDP
ncbi:TetR/AcrR family transcriptional regulator [Streptomyces sp. WAC 04229]|uniref:TetR/AcrR family transcriptional regulator n=1 Tax=Streptomyces sp. WAC 04229 TaxID=2203206 RepID=UPI003D7514B6